jgi:hypothetical protein
VDRGHLSTARSRGISFPIGPQTRVSRSAYAFDNGICSRQGR